MNWFDKLSASWVEANPNEDYSVLPPLVRLSRLSLLMESFQKEVCQPHDLQPTDYNVLAALRRSGEPFRLSPSELYGVLERSSGGMTKMLGRLQKQGLIRRVPDPDDGRSKLVQLTKKGQTVEHQVFSTYLEVSRQLLGDLEASELDEINQSLEKLMSSFESYFYRFSSP
ncbi:MarR family transcriptional regulator [Pseudomaricurvus alkylphenolicus]|uniref:MarR family winged helix-turn-helix transcriptional regulator n=1 Tax=Pseudomaricurvus alkylphenolicus TaxID=1306991 RepID=UPI0014219BEF|nr:MarR family transcriptional regulator [Pseudomaricurvus alkylphenolicus]NIB38967.1 MarR family transcriptional regulator [Pseudomaricurvus alkylphenolicus]